VVLTAPDFADLSQSPAQFQSTSCDVCVVGVGAAGAFVARRLSECGLSVLCLDAGGRRSSAPGELGFEPRFGVDPYPGAIDGRSFGLGGSTSRWGGLLVPHSRHDYLENDPQAKTWQHIVETVTERSESVLKCLGLRGSADFHSFAKRHLRTEEALLREMGIAVVSSLFLPFRHKNLIRLLEVGNRRDTDVRVFMSAVARDWSIGSNGAVTKLRAVAANGNAIEVTARWYLIAAGAIESARILLEIRNSAPPDVVMSSRIGEGLADHLSFPVADVASSSLRQVTSQYAPRFQGAWMRSFRFVPPRLRVSDPRMFAHFVFENDNPGFRLAKNVLTSLQARRLPRVSAQDLFTGFAGVARLGYGRFIEKRLHIPPATPTRMQLDLEQAPDSVNRIRLSTDRDVYGRRVVEIDWRITGIDMDHVRTASERFIALWRNAGSGLPVLIPRDPASSVKKPHDAYHPVGVCQMGFDEDPVVDHKLSVCGLKNLSVVSTAVLPSAGTANPTFTMLCLAEALIERLVEMCSYQSSQS